MLCKIGDTPFLEAKKGIYIPQNLMVDLSLE